MVPRVSRGLQATTPYSGLKAASDERRRARSSRTTRPPPRPEPPTDAVEIVGCRSSIGAGAAKVVKAVAKAPLIAMRIFLQQRKCRFCQECAFLGHCNC